MKVRLMRRVSFMKSDQDTSKLPEQQNTPSDLDPAVLQAALDQAYNAVIVTEAQIHHGKHRDRLRFKSASCQNLMEMKR